MARIDDLKKQHPQLDVSLIDIIASLDPTTTYKYLGFMLKLIKNEIGDNDPKKCFAQSLFDEDYINYINRFEIHSAASRLKNPDISSYKNINDIIFVVKEADEILKLKESEKQIIKLFESKEYLVLIPLTYDASKKYGANTKWCVTQPTYWKTYQWNYKLIYVIDKANNKKYAISRKYDDQTKIEGWLEDDTQISPFLISLSSEVATVISNEIRKSQYETEIEVLNENRIITDEGFVIPLDQTDRLTLNAFMIRFGNVISKSFNSKIQERYKSFVGLFELKENINNNTSKDFKKWTTTSIAQYQIGNDTEVLSEERINRIHSLMNRT